MMLRHIESKDIPTIREADLETAPSGIYRIVDDAGAVVTTVLPEYYDVLYDELKMNVPCERMARVMPPPAHEPKGVESYAVRPDGMAVIVALLPVGTECTSQRRL